MAVQTGTRISGLFERCKAEGRKAFIGYITAGDPTPETTTTLALALERGGVDLIELGVPFSDPIADGPVIQRASDRALRAGMTTRKVLEIVRQMRQKSEIPIVLFSYLNPLLRYGFDALAKDSAHAGVDGVLMTDLCIEEAEDAVRRVRAQGLDTVFLGAPTSTDQRLRRVAEQSSGFVYLVSRAGITGEQASLSNSAAVLVHKMRELSSLPLAVGFGISTPEQVKQIGAISDGVVVGSAIVRFIEEHATDPALPQKLEHFARQLSTPLRSA
ncbi:MAG: tryptophan synthase subunit alpha [Bryobacteraceae bacterium]